MKTRASDERILQIATNFMQSTPPGEFWDVIQDLRALAPQGLINPIAYSSFKEFNEEQLTLVDVGGRQILITKFGEIGESEYLDPFGNQVIKFDQVRGVAVDARPILATEIDQNYEPFRLEMQSQVLGYCSQYYPEGASVVYSSAKDNSIIVCISAAKFNPDNYWNGRWRSIWYVQFGENGLNLYGSLRINVHYYEDGNVQLNIDSQKNISVDFGQDLTSTAVNAIMAIHNIEQAFEQAVEQDFNSIGDQTMKALRRFLPVTKAKFNWSNYGHYRVAKF